MSTQTLTLTDFLLARVVDDEIRAMQAGPYVGEWDLQRILRECEAKRRIVERALVTEDQIARGVEMGFPNEFAKVALVAYEDDMKALAAIYTDHPDYRDEWRP